MCGRKARDDDGASPEYRMCISLDSVKFREAVLDGYKHRRNSSFARRDIFDVCPGMVGVRRASTPEPRSALFRARKHLLPANPSGLEDVSGREGEASSEGTALLLMAAQSRGTGY